MYVHVYKNLRLCIVMYIHVSSIIENITFLAIIYSSHVRTKIVCMCGYMRLYVWVLSVYMPALLYVYACVVWGACAFVCVCVCACVYTTCLCVHMYVWIVCVRVIICVFASVRVGKPLYLRIECLRMHEVHTCVSVSVSVSVSVRNTSLNISACTGLSVCARARER